MQLSSGASVFASNHEKVGEVDRVVIHPNGGQVTHIVVRKGFLLQSDKVVPLDQVERSTADEVHLKIPEEQLDSLPDLVETDFVRLDEDEAARLGYRESAIPAMYWYPTIGSTAMFGGPGYWGAYPPPDLFPYKAYEKENIPKGTIALKEGAEVLDDVGQKIGKVEKVLLENQGKHVTHLVVERGTLNKEQKIVPAGWIKAVKEDGVQLAVNAEFFDKLGDYS